MLSSKSCAFLAGAGRDCLLGIADIAPARREGCILFVGRSGICGVKSSVFAPSRSGAPCVDMNGRAESNDALRRLSGDGCRDNDGGPISAIFVCDEPYAIVGTASPIGAGGKGGDEFDWNNMCA